MAEEKDLQKQQEEIKDQPTAGETPAGQTEQDATDNPDTGNTEVEQQQSSESQQTTSGGETQKKEVAAVETGTVDSRENDDPEDFDWDLAKRELNILSEKEYEEMEKLYESTFREINEHEIVVGRVEAITDNDVVLNIGFKSDGLVPLSEFRDMPDLKVGDEVEVYVVEKENEKGQLVLSRKNAKLLKAWQKIVDAYHNDKIIEGEIVSKTKGGLIVNIDGLETFLPGSQIDVKPITDYDAYVGKRMEFKVVKINEAIKNAVVSHKALIESDLEAQRQEIISKLEKGQVLEGTVKNLTDFGAFIDLGGVDGLLYITDISWGRINHPSEVLELNQKVNVVVLDYDEEKKRISLGMKQLEPHPWETLGDEIKEGAKVKGKIVNIEDYGAFLEIKPGVEGLIHVSEVSWSTQPINAKEYFKLGEEIEALVLTVDREEHKMSLSIKRLTPDPWENIEQKYPVGSKHKGIVKNITPYGVFVELEEGIGGMVHVSDLSWTKRYNHPSEYVKVDDELEVVVLDIDRENRKLSLGHKQIEEDPWDTFEEIFPEGSVHEATVLRKDSKGAVVLMPYGVEAFAPLKHLTKEDGTTLSVDETAPFEVIEFDRNDKRIIVSHLRYWENQKRSKEEGKKKKEEKRVKKALKSQSKIEKTTLGDLDVLSDLKQQFEQAEKKEKKEKKETASKASKKKSAGKEDEQKPESGEEG